MHIARPTILRRSWYVLVLVSAFFGAGVLAFPGATPPVSPQSSAAQTFMRRHKTTSTATATATPTDTATATVTPTSTPVSTPTATAAGASPSASTYDTTILADHPVAFWDVNNPSGTETDLTGNGHTGTYQSNGQRFSLAPMMNGDQATDFNGNHQYLTIPSSPAFSIPTTHQLTWEGWIRPDILQWTSTNDPNVYNYVDWMGKCVQYSPSCEWEARMYNSSNPQGRCNRISAYVFNPSAGLGSAADWQPTCNLLQAGQWLYVVGEYQTVTTPSVCNAAYPGTINIWVNGVEQDFAIHEPTGCMSQHSIFPVANNSPLDIGTMAFDTWFPGAIGKVAIYNTLLTQTQINTHFTAMTGAAVSGSCATTCTIPVPTQ